MPPEELSKSGWVQKIGGVIIVPHNVMYTCTAGQARMLDYVIVPAGAEVFFRNVFARPHDDWTSHDGIEVHIDAEPIANIRWSLRLPAPFENSPAPPKLPDPTAKPRALS